MSDCVHCGGRGWGIRRGYVRCCELCEALADDDAARKAAEPLLLAFALRERPVAAPSAKGVVCWPWCSHLPSYEGDDFFTKLDAEEVFANAKFEVDAKGRVGVVVGRCQTAAVNHGDSFLACPACARTFEISDDVDPHFRNI
jgi:hypothetical protein